MSKEKIGVIDGHEIFVETGPDYQQIMLEAVRKKVSNRKLKEGQHFIMIIDCYGEQFLTETKVQKWNDR